MVSVNQDTCIGCGLCAQTCPEIFEIKDGKSFVKKGQGNLKEECLKEAVDNCPTGSISM